MDIKIIEEKKCISMLLSLQDSWDNLVMAIGSNNMIFKIDDVVASLLFEEMRWNNMEGLTHGALMVRGRLFEKGKGKFSSRKSKLRGRSKTISRWLGPLTRRC